MTDCDMITMIAAEVETLPNQLKELGGGEIEGSSFPRLHSIIEI